MSPSPPTRMRSPMAVLHWARTAAWLLLGAGFLLLIASAVWGLGWGPVAVALIAAGYCIGVIAVLPIIVRTIRALVAAVAAKIPGRRP